jgi:anaerobic selenocysteine-containing dehydrogenase
MLDCPDACTLDVSTEHGRVVQIDVHRTRDATVPEFICGKVRGFTRHLEDRHRLLYPLRRVGPKGAGAFDRISWDEAVAAIASQFDAMRREHGGETILPYHYGGSNGLVTDGLVDAVFFARLGASQLQKTLCAVPTTAAATAMYGKMPGVAFEDFAHAQCIVVWGGNPRVSNTHLMPYLKAARRRGAFVAVVDPVRTLGPSDTDLHLPVRPGTDLPLALAVARCWREWGHLDADFLASHATGVEELLRCADAWPLDRASSVTGVPTETIECLAREFAERNPAVVRCGWGPERNRHGCHAIAAILALPALVGKFGVRGGGYTLSNSGAVAFDRDAVIGPTAAETRTVNQSQLGAALTGAREPAVHGLFVYNCNPAVTAPDQVAVLEGLARDDLFTVVFDQMLTDTAAYADIVLPAPTFLEQWDIRVGYGRYAVGVARPVCDPPGEARSNVEVFGMLGRAMGLSDDVFNWSEEEAVNRVLAHLEVPGHGPLDPATGGHWPVTFDGGEPVQFGTVFPRTPDGKIHLTPAVLGAEPYRYADDGGETRYPLSMISPATARLVNSTMGQYALPELYVEVHPDDAAPRRIANGDRVRVFNDRGEVVCTCRVTDRVRPGVVVMPKGAWRASSVNGHTATALCPAHVDPVAGGACFNDARVELGKAR